MLKKNLLKRITLSSKNNIKYTHFHRTSGSSQFKKNKHVRFKNKDLSIPKCVKKRIMKILRLK